MAHGKSLTLAEITLNEPVVVTQPENSLTADGHPINRRLLRAHGLKGKFTKSSDSQRVARQSLPPAPSIRSSNPQERNQAKHQQRRLLAALEAGQLDEVA